MPTLNLTIDIINDDQFSDLPNFDEIHRWLSLVLIHEKIFTASLSLTYLSLEEIQTLNEQYRDKNYPTNILSFPFEAPPGLPADALDDNFLGDLVVSPDILEKEATEQGKPLKHHQAHILIHGLLHLIGYDHIADDEREEMETLEIKLLKELTIPNPYDPEVING
ncbi:rRNA maturation RNase YbeY [Thiotrichales bacterium 19S3-7]|nr:rRNA maturation RNase YbeY [Thiotrichales bacterium 19S3-7]MCF6801217.1 rRNA maturation RNase YbeY [Thiotrichales bacterium 19S3-11]